MQMYKAVYKGGEGEIIEKKSRFIATVRPVETEEEANSFIEEMRKKYWNATHNCFAYVIGINNNIQRCSDDGEPVGTAGKPMLDVLLGADIHNIAVVVTRYFGGTLLGTGGLVRAYSKSTQEGIANSIIIEKQVGQIIIINTNYNDIGKILYIIGQMNINTLDTQYTDIVILKVIIEKNSVKDFYNKVINATNGNAKIEEQDECYFAIIEKQVKLFI